MSYKSEMEEPVSQDEHYIVFSEDRGNVQADYDDFMETVNKKHNVICVLYLGLSLCLIALLVFGGQIGLAVFQKYYLNRTIVIIVASPIFGGIVEGINSAVSKKDKKPIGMDIYNRLHSNETLFDKLEQEFKGRKRRMNFRLVISFIISFIVVGGVAFVYASFAKSEYTKNFMYSPEVIGTYYGSGRYWDYRCEALSCDEEGNVEFTLELMRNETGRSWGTSTQCIYAKIKQTGKIKKKDFQGIEVEGTSMEFIYLMGDDRDSFSDEPYDVIFKGNYKNCNSLVVIDSINRYELAREPVAPGETEERLKQLDILRTYEFDHYPDRKLTFSSCDENGGVKGTYKEEKDGKYLLREFTGRLVFVSIKNDWYWEITLGRYIHKDFEQSSTTQDVTLASICEGDCSEMIFGTRLFESTR